MFSTTRKSSSRRPIVIVLDASVVLKWLLEDPATEPDTDKATALVEAVIRGELQSTNRGRRC
jgi:hypothetical protein